MQVPPRCEVCGEQLGRCEAHQSIPGILRPLFAALHRLESSRAPKACSAASSPYIVPFGALLLTQRPLNWVDSASTFYNYFGPGGPKKEHVLGGEFGLRLVGSVFWRIVDDDQVGYPDVTWLDAIIAAIDERIAEIDKAGSPISKLPQEVLDYIMELTHDMAKGDRRTTWGLCLVARNWRSTGQRLLWSEGIDGASDYRSRYLIAPEGRDDLTRFLELRGQRRHLRCRKGHLIEKFAPDDPLGRVLQSGDLYSSITRITLSQSYFTLDFLSHPSLKELKQLHLQACSIEEGQSTTVVAPYHLHSLRLHDNISLTSTTEDWLLSVFTAAASTMNSFTIGSDYQVPRASDESTSLYDVQLRLFPIIANGLAELTLPFGGGSAEYLIVEEGALMAELKLCEGITSLKCKLDPGSPDFLPHRALPNSARLRSYYLESIAAIDTVVNEVQTSPILSKLKLLSISAISPLHLDSDQKWEDLEAVCESRGITLRWSRSELSMDW